MVWTYGLRMPKPFATGSSMDGEIHDGQRLEKAKALLLSRAGFISNMTRIQREVESHIQGDSQLVDMDKKLASYKTSWRNLVGTHEKYLDVIDGESD